MSERSTSELRPAPLWQKVFDTKVYIYYDLGMGPNSEVASAPSTPGC